MALTREFKDTVKARVERDLEFRLALLHISQGRCCFGGTFPEAVLYGCRRLLGFISNVDVRVGWGFVCRCNCGGRDGQCCQYGNRKYDTKLPITEMLQEFETSSHFSQS